MQRRTLLSALAPGVALGCLGLTAAPARAQALGDKIVLGQSAAFSGPSAELGQQYHLGAKLYFDRINASGGIDEFPRLSALVNRLRLRERNDQLARLEVTLLL